MRKIARTIREALPVALAIHLASVCAWADEATSTVRGTVAGQVPGNPVWVGVFAGDQKPVWTRAEKGRFAVPLPLEQSNEEATLLTVSKDRVPLALPLPRDTAAQAVELRLSPGLRLAGVVLSEDGTPLPGAVLTIAPAEAAGFEKPSFAKLRWESGRRGAFAIGGLRPGRHVVWATAEGHLPLVLKDVEVKPQSDGASEDGVNHIEVRLAPAFFVTGRVFDSDGAPVANAQVQAHVSRTEQHVEALTGADGTYRLGPFERDTWVRLFARALGLGSSTYADAKAPHEGLALRLTPHLIRGNVVAADTGDPVTRFQLTTFAYDKEPHRHHAVESQDGVFEILVDAEVDFVILDAPGRFPWFSQLVANTEDGSEYDVGEITLDHMRTVKGSVVDARTGAPIVGALVFPSADPSPRARLEVMLFREATQRNGTTTDKDGNFALARMPARDTWIGVIADGYLTTRVEASSATNSLDVELTSGGVIAGSFTLPDGSMAPGDLSIKPLAADFFVLIQWARGGFFRSVPLPDGDYRVEVKSGAGAVESREVVIQSGRSVENVHLVMQPHDGRLAGRITGLLPQQTVSVTVRDHEGWTSHRRYFSNGEYALQGVPEIAVVTAAIASNRLVRQVRLDDQGEARVNFDFSGRSRLEGVVRAGGRPVGGVRVTVTPEDRSQPMASVITNEQGQYFATGLANGWHMVRARWQSFELEMTDESQLDLALVDGSVYGTALLAGTDEPAVGAFIHLTPIDGDRRIGAGLQEEVASNGVFQFRGIAEGTYMVEVLWHYRMAPWRVQIGDGEALELSLELEPIDQ